MRETSTIRARLVIEMNKLIILFVCVHNAGRSQMAAAFTKQLGGDRVEVLSAGTEPADQLNPQVVQAMNELGLDLHSQVPRLLCADDALRADYVITMGCGDTCPFFPGKIYLDWKFDDPQGKSIDEVRSIRDAIKVQVSELLASH